jgi:hypothetical protein
MLLNLLKIEMVLDKRSASDQLADGGLIGTGLWNYFKLAPCREGRWNWG